MPKDFSSRLARRQGKKMMRQSALMIFLAIAGLLLFVFVIMPQAVQLFFRIIGTGDLSSTANDTVPPQVPVVTLTPEATKETSLAIEGFGEADSEVVVVINGQEVGRTAVDTEGKFTYTLSLEEGENTVSLYGVDEAGNESHTRDFTVTQDNQAPTLAFEDLENGKQVTLRKNQTLEIRGETEVGAQLILNDRTVFVRTDGTFSTSLFLQEGDNALHFVATDKAGNTTDRSVTVNFRL
jgi:bacillopeptidase F